MNTKQFSERVGNIDDRLIQDAYQMPNYSAKRRRQFILD